MVSALFCDVYVCFLYRMQKNKTRHTGQAVARPTAFLTKLRYIYCAYRCDGSYYIEIVLFRQAAE